MAIKKLIGLLFLLISIAGCITLLPKEKIHLLNTGINKKEIVARIGKPTGIWQGYAQITNENKQNRTKIPFEIWEYYISGGENSLLLYIYKDQLKQIEELNEHILKVNNNHDIKASEIPKINFNELVPILKDNRESRRKT